MVTSKKNLQIQPSLNRRQFMVSGLTAGGGFLIGGILPSVANAKSSSKEEHQIGFFIEILSDNSIVIGNNQPEIGQGLRSTLPMLVAEELEVDWKHVSVKQMPYGLVKTKDGYAWKYGGQGVGGSTGLKRNFNFMREVGAKARLVLQQAAAKVWNVEITQTSCKNGTVTNTINNKTVPYSDLISVASQLPLSDEVPELKPVKEFKIAGTRRKTLDAFDIVTGQSKYGIDAKVEGAFVAVMQRCPYLDGTVKSFDDAATKKIKGVVDVVLIKGPKEGEPYFILAEGVAVIAENTWAAIEGRKALKVEWNTGPNVSESSESFIEQCDKLLTQKGQIVRDDGDFEGAIKTADKVIKHEYFIPYVNHAPMEPQNCFAHVTDNACKAIIPTQSPSGASRGINKATGIERENIEIELTRIGGGFGRRLTNDYAVEAALISKKSGKPINLLWTREDDMQHDFYRPSGKHQMIAGLDKNNQIIAWTQRLASASKYYRRPNMTDDKLWGPELYEDDYPAHIIPNFQREYFPVKSGVPRGSWRAPAHTANAFVIQSFIDEIAHETEQDPLECQLNLLGEARELDYSNHGGPKFNPGRLAKLLKFVAKEIDHKKQRPKGSGVGIATHFTFGGYAAHAIEVSVSQSGKLTIDRIVAAIDCGFAVSPNAVEAQVQGATVDGLSTALNLEITVKDGQIVQNNFHQYPLATIASIPENFKCHILPWDDVPTGVGEIPIPPVAPALTNAIFNATGIRIRRLPIANQLAV